PSVAIGFHAVVGDIQTSFLENHGGRYGILAPFPATVMPAGPLARSSAAGGTDVVVRSHQSVTLAPGHYGALKAFRHGTLLLDAGVYEFASATLGDHVRLLSASSSGAVDLRIAGHLTAGAGTRICPVKGTADKLSITVSGEDGPYGTPAASIGATSRLIGLLAVPHGTLALAQGVHAAGALAGFDVRLGD